MNQNSPQTVSTPGRALTPKTQQSAILDLKQKALEVIALTPEVRSQSSGPEGVGSQRFLSLQSSTPGLEPDR